MTRGYRLPTTLTGYDLDYVCIPVPKSREYRIAFWGQLLDLTRWWVWEHDGTNRAKTAADYWLSFLQTAYENTLNGNGCIVKLRANPIEPCELQYSTDGGETWHVGFDYAACLNTVGTGITNQITTEINVNTYIDNITTIYDNDYTNIAPDMTFGGSGSDDDRNLALCNAINLLVQDFALLAIDYAKERFEESQEVPSLVALALGAAAAISSIFVTPAGGALLYVSLGTALAGIGLEAWIITDEADFSAYEDDDALNQVACYMYAEMADANPTAASFAAALSGESFTGNAEIIAEALAPTLANEETYVLLLQYMQDTYDLIQIGADISCVCSDEWTNGYDFAASDAGWVGQEIGTNEFAQWISSSGWRQDDDNTSRRIIVNDLYAGTHVVSVRVYRTAEVVGNLDAIRIQDQVFDAGGMDIVQEDADGLIQLVEIDHTFSNALKVAEFGDLDQNGTTIPGYIYYLEVTGTGINPDPTREI